MPEISKPEFPNEHISAAVNLVAAMLMRYPEISTINFEPQNNCVKIMFVLSEIPPADHTDDFKALLLDSITAYLQLEKRTAQAVVFELSTHEGVATLTITRDIYTISKNELSLITALINEHLLNYVLTEPMESAPAEDQQMHDNIIDDQLQFINTNHIIYNLIGIREKGKILVFNN